LTAPSGARLGRWIEALQTRHLADRTFAEARRGLQALSSLYVERRARIASGAALSGSGKRAAFALFYGPVHFLVAERIVVALGANRPSPREILDLGCGTGVVGAAWAIAAGGTPRVVAVDRHPWSVAEARWTLRALGVRGTARTADLVRVPLRGAGRGVALGFAVNELDAEARARLLGGILAAAKEGAAVLVLEPLAKAAAPWWPEWTAAFREAGGREDAWKLEAELPPPVERLGRAAGLDPRALTARSLFLPAARTRSG